MPATIKHVQVWRTNVDHTPGQLARVLAPLAAAGADLQLAMAYRVPGEPAKAVIEIYPVKGKKQATAAGGAGLAASDIPVLLIEGDNAAGMGAAITSGLADAGINLTFLVAQVMGKKYAAVVGFENEADARRAAAIVKKVGAPKKKRSTGRATKR
jgi:hypothetical protein